MKNKILGNIKFLNLVFVIIYVFEYHYSYTNFVFFAYNYAAISQKEESMINFPLMLFVICMPLLFFKKIYNIASSFSFMIYILVFIPFIHTLFCSELPFDISALYTITFTIIMSLYFITDRISLYKHSFKNSSSNSTSLRFKSFEFISILLLLLLFFVFRNSMSFYNMFSESDELYEFRSDSNLAQSGGILFVYLLLWAENVILPILLVNSYVKRNKILFMFYFFCFVGIFMVTKTKVTLVMPIAMWCVLFFYLKYKRFVLNYFHLFFMTTIGILSYILCRLYEFSVLFLPFTTLLNYRIQSVEGAQLERYLNFFVVNNNPYTYYSHIKIVNAITHMYPYSESIGMAVAGNGANSNATFFLMDGVAACGIIGCIISALLFGIIKCVYNSISVKYNYFLIVVVLLYSYNSVINTSLFTSLFSFGLIPLYIILKYVKIDSFLFCRKNNSL